MTKNEDEVLDKVKLYMSIGFWMEVLTTIDRKIEFTCEGYKYGSVDVKFIIQDGAVSQIVFNDEVRIKGAFQKK